MKKGMALEGYIMQDKTIRPLKHYDDTELREKIQTNTDEIDNLKSKTDDIDDRVEYLETHGGAEDPTKADKVVDATEDHFASLDNEGNLQDSGYSELSFAAADHNHDQDYAMVDHSHSGISSSNGGEVYADNNKVYIGVLDAEEDDHLVEINNSNIGNLERALETPDAAVLNNDKLVKGSAVLASLAKRLRFSNKELLLVAKDDTVVYPITTAIKQQLDAICQDAIFSDWTAMMITLDSTDLASGADVVVVLGMVKAALSGGDYTVTVAFSNGYVYTATKHNDTWSTQRLEKKKSGFFV